jgi:hypothetical protein
MTESKFSSNSFKNAFNWLEAIWGRMKRVNDCLWRRGKHSKGRGCDISEGGNYLDIRLEGTE